ncbi:MAG: hypothetical protein Q7K28_01000 [Candidatus Wildermuthbacteria bacterium]|nr:hypothetical protein [Candidatus Wildermuthbacteria bacterium]
MPRMKITERQEKLLDWIVKDYINLAEPISSESLRKRHKFGLSPATLRIEMQKLTDKGFLRQPHTSAGRVPTDKGYRFFVDRLAEEEKLTFGDTFTFDEIFEEERNDVFKFADHLAKALAEASSGFSVFHLLKENISWKEGWGEVLKQPEFGERDFIADFNNLLENFEEGIDNLEINSGVKIYIGRENPFSKTKEFSIMMSRCRLPKGEEGVISILGPKRMDYERNINLIDSIRGLLADTSDEGQAPI